MVKKKTSVSLLTIILIVLFIFSSLSTIEKMNDYSVDIYYDCRERLSEYNIEHNGAKDLQDIYICGAERKISLLNRNISFITSMLLLFLIILSWKIDKLNKDKK